MVKLKSKNSRARDRTGNLLSNLDSSEVDELIPCESEIMTIRPRDFVVSKVACLTIYSGLLSYVFQP
jgi:hypothetical protein